MRSTNAFTLAEILVVLTILALTAGIAIPRAEKTSSFNTLRQESLNLLAAARLALDYAARNNAATRLLLDTKSPAFVLQVSSPDDPDTFLPLPGAAGQTRFLRPDFYFYQSEGFSKLGDNLILSLDPRHPWPLAKLTLVYRNQSQTISIAGQNFEITDENQND